MAAAILFFIIGILTYFTVGWAGAASNTQGFMVLVVVLFWGTHIASRMKPSG